MSGDVVLGPDGSYRRDGAVFVPVGVNCHVPNPVDRAAIAADLRAAAALGLNAVRVDSAAARAAIVAPARAAGLVVLDASSETSTSIRQVRFSAEPGAHVLGFDGLSDPFFHTFLPFAVRCARLRGPVIVSSLRVGARLGPEREDAWLRAALPAARRAGSAAFFWESLRGPDGLLTPEGHPLPGRAYFGGFAREIHGVPAADRSADIALLMPEGAESDDHAMRRALVAQYFLGKTDPRWRCVRPIDIADGGNPALLVGSRLSREELARLQAWVAGGGRLFWHGPDPVGWDETMTALLGARPVDWRSGRGISVNAFGERFTLAHFPRGVRVELEPVGARVLATDQHDLPVLLEHAVGRGRVRYALPIVEDAVLPVAGHPAARDRWEAWYRGMLAG